MSKKGKTGPWLPSVEELEAFLKKRLIGQDHAIVKLVKRWGFFKSGFKDFDPKDAQRPIGVFMFLGPSRVGKTELGKVLAQALYGTPEAIALVDMAGLKEPHRVAKLVGAPPGYVGYQDPAEFSPEKLYAKIPGWQERVPRKSDRQTRREVNLREMILGPVESMQFEYHMTGAQKAQFEVALREIELIEKCIVDLNENLQAVEQEEKQKGRRSHQNEQLKKRYLDLMVLAIKRREKIAAEYLSHLKEREAAQKTEEEDKKVKGIIPVKSGESAPEESPTETASPEKSLEEPILIIILDEIEKAHPDIHDFLLHVFDEGVVPLSDGRETSFKKAFIIMTSNLAAKTISSILRRKEKSLGFIAHNSESDIAQAIQKELEKTFTVEFINRLDEIIIFNDLNKANLLEILDLRLGDFVAGLERHQLKVALDAEAKQFILKRALQTPERQAAALEKEFKELIKVPLSEKFVRGEIRPGQTVTIKISATGDSLHWEVGS